jgi:spore coat polysaccharide biosynthesis protein SpsF
MLLELGGLPLLEWVTRRTLSAVSLDSVVLATTELEEDDALVSVANNLGVPVHRGSSDDVVGRILAAAKHAKADAVVRICGDNPFVDPEEIDNLVRHFFSRPVKYAFNHRDMLGSGHSDGFGAEIIKLERLDQLYDRAQNPIEREHMTMLALGNLQPEEISFPPSDPMEDDPCLSFDVNFEKELIYLRAIVASGVGIFSSKQEVLRAARTGKV